MSWKAEKETSTRFVVVSLSNGSIYGYYQNIEGAELASSILNNLSKIKSDKKLNNILNLINNLIKN